MRPWHLQALVIISISAANQALGLQVFLTNLTVFTKHRLRFEGDLRVYFQCDGNDRVNLPDVRQEGIPYSWPREDLLLTTVTRGSCKTCGFREDRLLPFVPDDQIGGGFPLCEGDFSSADAQDNMVRWYADTQFDAVLFCGDCERPAPPPPPVAAPPTDAVTSFVAHEAGSVAAGGAGGSGRRWWQSAGAIAGMSAGAAVLLGFGAGLAAYAWYRQQQQRSREERARAFEAVFSDPELDLEEVAAQDARAMRGLAQLFGRPWTRLRDTQVSGEL